MVVILALILMHNEKISWNHLKNMMYVSKELSCETQTKKVFSLNREKPFIHIKQPST